MAPRKNAALRSLFDEHVSKGVAQALAILGKPVTFVGQRGQVPKGTYDPEVAASSLQQRRVLVTFNFDMVLAACATGTRFIWFDQRSKNPGRMETALIFLRQWDEWEARMADASVVCLKVGRASVDVLTVEEAQKRALRRYKATLPGDQKHAKRKASAAQQTLLLSFEDDD